MLPTAKVLALDDHGPIAGTAATLGGTLQMGLGAVAVAAVGAVFNNSPMPLATTIVVCALVAVTISFVALKAPADVMSGGIETAD